MAAQQYRALLLVVLSVIALFVASPVLEKLVVAPQTQPFSELWVFGPNHNATYPSNVTADVPCHFDVNVVNHLGAAAYYVLEIKFRNQTQSGPDSFNQTASELAPLSSFTFFVADGQKAELPMDISFQYHMAPSITDRLDMQSIIVNGEALNVDSTSIAWNPDKKGFYGNLFFELYLYNDTANELQYHQRYVSLWLKMTS